MKTRRWFVVAMLFALPLFGQEKPKEETGIAEYQAAAKLHLGLARAQTYVKDSERQVAAGEVGAEEKLAADERKLAQAKAAVEAFKNNLPKEMKGVDEAAQFIWEKVWWMTFSKVVLNRPKETPEALKTNALFIAELVSDLAQKSFSTIENLPPAVAKRCTDDAKTTPEEMAKFLVGTETFKKLAEELKVPEPEDKNPVKWVDALWKKCQPKKPQTGKA